MCSVTLMECNERYREPPASCYGSESGWNGDSWGRITVDHLWNRGDLYGTCRYSTWFRLLSTSRFHYSCREHPRTVPSGLMWWQQSSSFWFNLNSFSPHSFRASACQTNSGWSLFYVLGWAPSSRSPHPSPIRSSVLEAPIGQVVQIILSLSLSHKSRRRRRRLPFLHSRSSNTGVPLL